MDNTSTLQHSRNGVAFRRPTFNGGKLIKSFWNGLVWRLQLLGYARTASELSRMGYHEEAKALMLELGKERQ